MGGKRKRDDELGNDIPKHSSKFLSATTASSSKARKGNANVSTNDKLVVSVGKFASRRFPEMEEFWRRHVISSGVFFDSSKYEGGRIPDTNYFYTQAIRCLKSQGGTCHSNRHLRRRTKSHTPIHRHRFPTAPPLPMDSAFSEPSNRRALRRYALKLQSIHRGWWKNADIHNNDAREESHRNSSSTNWLETHVWHAKRFYMSPPLTFEEVSSGANSKNTWCIPLAHTGRGIRSLLKRLQSEESPASTIQDHTWMHQPLLHLLITSNFKTTLNNFGIRLLGIPCVINEADGCNTDLCNEVIFYELDSYPLNCVGPGRMYTCSEDTSEGDRMHVFLSTHPSIRTHLHSVLMSWIDGLNNDGNSHVQFIANNDTGMPTTKHTISLLSNPTALFSIRGLGSTKTITSLLQPQHDSSCLKEGISQIFPFHCDHLKKLPPIPHLTMLSVTIQIKKLKNGDIKVVVEDDQDKGTMKEKAHTIPCLLLFVSPPARNHRCTVISGWDIICPAIHAKTIFLALQNDALAIGLCEESAMFLESGLPQFPRDFPDTPEGKKYWAVAHDSDNCWGIVRTCHEFSGRRFATHIKRAKRRMLSVYSQHRTISDCSSVNKCLIANNGVVPNRNRDTRLSSTAIQQTSFISIDWSNLLSTDNNVSPSKHSQVVLVRGEAFGMPFRQVLSGMGLLVPCVKIQRSNPVGSTEESEEEISLYIKDDYNTSSNQQPKRAKHRPRRKVRPISRQAQAFPQSKQNQIDHLKFCKELLGALSLPALLRCSLLLCGKGMIHPGDFIYECSKTQDITNTGAISMGSLLLGHVTAGYFSHSRGCVLGVGIISAKHFLSVVYRASLASTVVVPGDRAGQDSSSTDKRIQLRVLIKKAKNTNKNQVLREAALFILL